MKPRAYIVVLMLMSMTMTVRSAPIKTRSISAPSTGATLMDLLAVIGHKFNEQPDAPSHIAVGLRG
jgi:hypothetical protein